MAEFATLARPYARAAFEVALEDGDSGLDRWSHMLALLAAVAAVPALAEEFGSPARTNDAKAQLLIDVLGDDLDTKGGNLVHLLASNKRLPLLGDLVAQYEELKDAHLRTLEVEVISARPLSDADAEQLREKLAARFDKTIELSNRTDPSLLGGALIRAGDTVIDGSVRGRLDRLADTLRART